jgi:hypothetical protein
MVFYFARANRDWHAVYALQGRGQLQVQLEELGHNQEQQSLRCGRHVSFYVARRV